MSEETTGAPTEPGADRAERLLAELNSPQREAVRHGEGPLLVLAGAGSGKTRVLTHRIAYLLATGAARPGEILAITFTNKAAKEMRERVEALVGRSARAMWVTTFHSACARMLRADAERLGYSRSFTIYDESDSLRMLKRCLEELHVDPKRYPPRGDPLADLRRQEPADRRRRLRRSAGQRLRGGRRRGFPALREADARGQRDGLRRPAGAHGQRAGAVRGGARALAPRLPPRPRRRVPGHQPRPVPAAAAAHRRARQPDGGRRRGPVDLRLQARRHPQHPRLRARLPRGRGGQARAELPLDADDPLGRQRGRRAQPRTAAEEALDRARRRRAAAALRARRRARGGALGGGGDRAARRGGGGAARGRRGLLPDQRDEPGARGHAGPLRAALPGDRRHQVLRTGGGQGRGRLPQPAGQPVRPGLLRPGRQLAPAAGSAKPARRGSPRTPTRPGCRSGRSPAGPRRFPGSARRRSRRSTASTRRWRSCARQAETPRSPSCCEATLGETGYLDALAAERTVEAEGRAENLEELVGVAAEFDANRELEGEGRAGAAGGVPAADLPLHRAGRARRRLGDHADDPAQRQGARSTTRSSSSAARTAPFPTCGRSKRVAKRRSDAFATSASPAPAGAST